MDSAKQRVVAEVQARAADLLSVARAIHANPELPFEERFAHDLLAAELERAGLVVLRHAHGVETAFRASAGTRGPAVAILCEYDALPGLGHACGHNVIAAAGLGAGIAAAAVADACDGRVVVLGTPAEEEGGGKIELLERGAFDGVAAALMVHPSTRDVRGLGGIAVQRIESVFRGRSAHAAASPEAGRNALDAAVLAYMGVAALRQHLPAGERVHGVFTDGGQAPNVVPDRAAQHWFVRSPTLDTLERLRARVLACLDAGATAAGCTAEHEIHRAYAQLEVDPGLSECFAANAAAVGRDLGPAESSSISTDLGNVSLRIPVVHAQLRIAPDDVALHTPEFARLAVEADAERAVIDGAKALAMTAVDVWERHAAVVAGAPA